MLAAAERLRSVAAALQADIDAVRGSAALAELGAELTPDAGYEIQRHCQAIRVARGESPVGYKVGCTSARVQKAFGIPGPIYGRLWAGEQLQSAVAGAGVPLQVVLADFVGLAIEGELAVEIVEAPPDAPPAEWLVDYFPVIELHHCEFDCDAAVRAGEFIAKNGIHAGVVRAAGQPDGTARCRLGDIPLDVPINVTISGGEAKAGDGPWQAGWFEAAELGSLVIGGCPGPLGTVSWLHQQLGAELGADGGGGGGGGGGGDARALLGVGTRVLTATPGSLVRVRLPEAEAVAAGGEGVGSSSGGGGGGTLRVVAEFGGSSVECTVVGVPQA